jgi:serine/threonine-protein kinase Chk2
MRRLRSSAGASAASGAGAPSSAAVDSAINEADRATVEAANAAAAARGAAALPTPLGGHASSSAMVQGELRRLGGVEEVARKVRTTGHSQLDIDPIDFYYDIRTELGTGNFSTVKVGVHRETGRKYAVKIIDKTKFLGQPQFKKSVKEEIDILTKIQHPSVISIKEVFESKLRLYMILELVEGGELFDHIVSNHRLAEPECRDLFGQMLDAVRYLHSQGIVHRDLKPENLLLARGRNGKLRIKISDFGLSKMVGERRLMQTLCGTPQYLAPEVIVHSRNHKGYSAEVDMWSLGVILYIMLSGSQPFHDNGSQPALFELIRKGRYSFPDRPWAEISDAAKDLVRGMLNVDPTKRLTTDQALAHPWFRGSSSGGASHRASSSTGKAAAAAHQSAAATAAKVNANAGPAMQGGGNGPTVPARRPPVPPSPTKNQPMAVSSPAKRAVAVAAGVPAMGHPPRSPLRPSPHRHRADPPAVHAARHGVSPSGKNVDGNEDMSDAAVVPEAAGNSSSTTTSTSTSSSSSSSSSTSSGNGTGNGSTSTGTGTGTGAGTGTGNGGGNVTPRKSLGARRRVGSASPRPAVVKPGFTVPLATAAPSGPYRGVSVPADGDDDASDAGAHVPGIAREDSATDDSSAQQNRPLPPLTSTLSEALCHSRISRTRSVAKRKLSGSTPVMVDDSGGASDVQSPTPTSNAHSSTPNKRRRA